ncbi:MAG TPA: glycosyltransferase family 4 protein, partial [Thermomicrobiales bacterium]|nr:glycosyltransferase family 4 protein [Thermomicrobiales bacterium]
DAAAIALCREIVPALRAMTPRAVTATIAGGGAGPELRQAAKAAAVDLPGYVADLASVYRDAHVAVVSVRAGGGTRIKAIEAFAWRRPVVSTAFGVEGLGVRDGEHLLLADESEAMARQCLRLLAEPDLAGELVERAWRSFVSAWSTERLDAIVAALDAEPLPRATPAASARRDPR